MIEIYNKINTGISHLEQYTFYLEGINEFEFTKKEIACYLSILTNENDNNIEHYYNDNKIELMKTIIPTADDIYFFTHDLFYLTYLNAQQNFFDSIDPKKKRDLNEYIFSSIVFCMIEYNIDLLGELLICYKLINGQIDESMPLINMSLGYIEEYVNAIESNLMVDETIFIQTYHTILVILILVLI